MKSNFTPGALKAAEICRKHFRAINYVYEPDEAAKEIDQALRFPEILQLVQTIVDEAKQDLANSDEWQGPYVKVSRARIKELAHLIAGLNSTD